MTLLFCADTWVMSLRIYKTLGGFHHRMARQLEGMRLKRDTTGRWFCPPLDDEVMSVGLDEVYAYVLRLQNNIAQYIATRPILELYLATEQQLEAQVTQR